jgi:putative ABC transport system permease protein
MVNYTTKEAKIDKIADLIAKEAGVSTDAIKNYLTNKTDDEYINQLLMGVLALEVQTEYALSVSAELSVKPKDELATSLDNDILNNVYTLKDYANYYDNVTKFSESSYEENLKLFGYADINSPYSISIYASSFENKDVILNAINDYNKTVSEEQQIKYTDYMGLMMSSITTIIDAISYVLIAFVSISLVVSSIMIGVITLISVQERTKEIGILRAIGASKKDVSSMFNAETVIIGLSSGLTGVLFTYLLCIPINLILNLLTGLTTLNAILPLGAAGILVAISVLLNLISGIIPSRSAAKKDPVVALRTE